MVFGIILFQSKMNKLLICGLVMLSTTATPQHESPLLDNVFEEVVLNIDPEIIHEPQSHVLEYEEYELMEGDSKATPKVLAWYDVTYLEEEQPDLGFDTACYLPEDFDANAVPTEVEGFNYMEEETDLDPEFDTASYLPEGFDPYGIYFDLDAIVFLEEDDFDLGFDTAKYLPIGFDPYHDSIVVY